MRFPRSIPMIVALLSIGCGDDDGTDVTVTTTLDRVTVTSPTVTVQAGQQVTITPSGVDANNGTVTGVTFSYSSGSGNIAFVSSDGVVTGLAAGTSQITVTGTKGSVTKTTTVTVTVTGTLANAAAVVAGATSNVFTPAFVAVARGGTVSWTFPGTQHNVTFSAATGAPANIPNTANSTTPIARTFSTAGTFNYTCTLHAGMNGTVMVP
jgi:plastocyanin